MLSGGFVETVGAHRRAVRLSASPRFCQRPPSSNSDARRIVNGYQRARLYEPIASAASAAATNVSRASPSTRPGMRSILPGAQEEGAGSMCRDRLVWHRTLERAARTWHALTTRLWFNEAR